VRLGRDTQWVPARSFEWLVEHRDPSPPQLTHAIVPQRHKTNTDMPLHPSVIAGVVIAGALLVLFVAVISVQLSSGVDKLTQSDGNEEPHFENSDYRNSKAVDSPQAVDVSRDFELVDPPTVSDELVIHDLQDEQSVAQAVGLVICGWRGRDQCGRPFYTSACEVTPSGNLG